MARLGKLFLAIALVLSLAAAPGGAVRATGTTGPIQLGGDDQNDHGGIVGVDHDSDPLTPDVPATEDGWTYIMLSLETMLATELRAGVSNDFVVIGTDGSDAYVTGMGLTPNDGAASCLAAGEGEDTYCMVETVRAELDRRNGATAAPTVRYLELANDVDEFFEDLAAGTTNTAVILIPGDGGGNDLSDGASDDQVDDDTLTNTLMEQALIDNAATLAAFNAAGGGVLSSGSDHYLSWLEVLIPSIDLQSDDTSSTLGMTADGAALWAGLTDADISSAWHNSFTGDLGGLKVLAKGYNDDWVDADTDDMIDAGEATAFNWRGPNGTPGDSDDLQTVVVIGGAAGEAAIGEELPETNRSGSTVAYWLAVLALFTTGAALVLRGRKSA